MAVHETQTVGQAETRSGLSDRDLRWRRLRQRSPRFRLFLTLGAIVLVIAGVVLWRYFTSYESTDDAQIDGHLNPISARVSGHIEKILVTDNQYVAAGTPLAQIDPNDYQVAVERARANYSDAMAAARAAQVNVPVTSVGTSSQVSTAEAEVTGGQAAVATAQQQYEAAKAQLARAEANNTKAQNDVLRYAQLVAKQEISQQQYDQAVATAKADAAAVAAAQAGVQAAQQGINQVESKLAQARANLRSARTAPEQVAITRAKAQGAAANVQRAKAELDQAELNLQYATVVSPVNGVVTGRTVEVGQNVQPGQELMRIINLEDIWVTADFKETQLRNMKVGQSASVHVDATDNDYQAEVQSFSGASGAVLSLLPPENATGNYVKVVQRLPIKIVFAPGQNSNHRLRPGMSVEVKVWTRKNWLW